MFFRHDRRLFAEISKMIFAKVSDFYSEVAGKKIDTGMVIAHFRFFAKRKYLALPYLRDYRLPGICFGRIHIFMPFCLNMHMFEACDFLSKLTQHIPPKGVQLIRRYGLYSSSIKVLWESKPYWRNRSSPLAAVRPSICATAWEACQECPLKCSAHLYRGSL